MSSMSGRDGTLLWMLTMLGDDVSEAEAIDVIGKIESPYAQEVARALTGVDGKVSETARRDAAHMRARQQDLPEAPVRAAK